jgi:N6-adenosine-specific RNA methylase IME4
LPDGVKTQLVGLRGIAVLPDRMRKLRPEVVAELAESIRVQGLLHPILLRPRSRNGIGFILVAGRHRLEAVRALKHDSIRAEIREGLVADAAELAEIDENLIRADLTPAERAMHIGRRKELYEKVHPETKHGGAPGKAGGGKKAKAANLASFEEHTAKATGKSKRSTRRDATRAKNVVVLDEIAGTCLDKGDEIDALAKLPPKEQRALAAAARKGKKVSAKVRLKQIKRESRERELAEKTKQAALALDQLPPASVIVSDPALKFKTWSDKGLDRAADNHYACGSIDEMIALKPPMADDAILFLWTWSPQLQNAMKLLEAWGFEYKFYSGWDKEIDGTGHWALSRLELILVGTRGKIPAPAPGQKFPQLFKARRGKHSEKPDEVYREIERLFPNLIKLEMFARKPRPGWLTWGNEASPIRQEAAE